MCLVPDRELTAEHKNDCEMWKVYLDCRDGRMMSPFQYPFWTEGVEQLAQEYPKAPSTRAFIESGAFHGFLTKAEARQFLPLVARHLCISECRLTVRRVAIREVVATGHIPQGYVGAGMRAIAARFATLLPEETNAA